MHRRGKDEFAASCDEEWLTRGRGNDNLSLLQSSGPDAAETNTGLLQDQALTAGGWRQQNTLAGLMTWYTGQYNTALWRMSCEHDTRLGAQDHRYARVTTN